MEKILIPKNDPIYIDLREQVGKKGIPFRLSGTTKIEPSKWIDKEDRWHWLFTYRYINDKSHGFEIEIDYYDNFVSKKDF